MIEPESGIMLVREKLDEANRDGQLIGILLPSIRKSLDQNAVDKSHLGVWTARIIANPDHVAANKTLSTLVTALEPEMTKALHTRARTSIWLSGQVDRMGNSLPSITDTPDGTFTARPSLDASALSTAETVNLDVVPAAQRMTGPVQALHSLNNDEAVWTEKAEKFTDHPMLISADDLVRANLTTTEEFFQAVLTR